ncbi:hypothetical protein Rwratislav_38271 [Rhodococcus wratislaviensis IFP 2016]|nr:hypothetical protein Rwratislav_38271 [Rhodococcus wratislaviensis IFP 2016]
MPRTLQHPRPLNCRQLGKDDARGFSALIHRRISAISDRPGPAGVQQLTQTEYHHSPARTDPETNTDAMVVRGDFDNLGNLTVEYEPGAHTHPNASPLHHPSLLVRICDGRSGRVMSTNN